MSATAFIIDEFTAVERNTLRGFARVRMPSGMIIADVAIHVRDGNAWASPPSKPVLGRDGTQMKSVDGKPQWAQLILFTSREQRDRWSEAVLTALRTSHPHALDGENKNPGNVS